MPVLRAFLVSTCSALAIACSSEAPTNAPAPHSDVADAQPTPKDGGSDAPTGDDAAPPDNDASSDCTTFTYSDWGVCDFRGTQTRTVTSREPEDCFLTGLVLKQDCTFVAPTDGPGLYQAYCNGCHGNAKKGSSSSAIKNAITGNRGGMGVLSDLTQDQIDLISSAP